MGAYCSDDEMFTLGLPAQAFVSRPRPFDAIDPASGTIRLKAHGLTVDDLVTFEVTSGGALPTGVSAFTPYFPIPVAFDLFKVSATSGGAALTFVSGGSGWGLATDPLRRLRMHAVEAAAEIDQYLTAHAPPIQPDASTGKYPQLLVGLNARMAVRAAVTSLQVENAAYRIAVDRLFAKEEADKAMLQALRDGWPLYPIPRDTTPDVGDNAAIGASDVPAILWNRGCL